MSLVVLGLSHHTAPVEVRERVAFTPDEALATLRRLKSEQAVGQALLLSTCNRTEIYALAHEPKAGVERLRDAVFGGRLDTANGLIYAHVGELAVRHLYRVACGLDSMVLGEHEILGQVKDAYDIAVKAESLGSVLHRLVHSAVHAGKRARRDTEIGAGAVSVASTAVELAEKVFGKLTTRPALLVGAGENGKLCAQHLLGHGVEPLFIANRTLARAEALASELGGEVVAFDELGAAMAKVDIVVTTTGAPEPILGADAVKLAMRDRQGRELVLIDIAVPRDVAPDVDELYNVFRFDIDALHGIVAQNLSRRQAEVPRVEELVQGEVTSFMRWWASLDAGPVIRDLHARFESIRAAEIAKHGKRFTGDNREQAEVFSRALVQRLLTGVTQEIKGYRLDNPAHRERLAVLRHVFGLDAPVAQDASDHDDT